MKLVPLDKLGWPVERFRGRPILNAIRLLLHTRRVITSAEWRRLVAARLPVSGINAVAAAQQPQRPKMIPEYWPIVIVESPFAGDMEANAGYARRACMDCLRRQEVPYASHLFFPQILDEMKPEERELGLTAGYAMWRDAAKVVFYIDRGMSPGMERARVRASELGLGFECRYLDQQKEPTK